VFDLVHRTLAVPLTLVGMQRGPENKRPLRTRFRIFWVRAVCSVKVFCVR
jgi:hypothetical protein